MGSNVKQEGVHRSLIYKRAYNDPEALKERHVVSSPAVITIATTKSRIPVNIRRTVSNKVKQESLKEQRQRERSKTTKHHRYRT